MRTDRFIAILVVIVLVAAAAVFLSKRASSTAAPEPTPEVPVAGAGSLSLLVVGVEGMDLSIAERLVGEGRMPNLEALMDEGAVSEFSTLGKNVDRRIAWTSLVTGVSPENQGIGGTKESPRGDVVEASLTPKSRTVGTLWTALSDSGTPVGVLGWWGDWPVEQLNGVVLAPYQTYLLEREHNGLPEKQLYPLEFLDTVDGLMSAPGIYSRVDLSRFVNTESPLGLEALIGKGYEDLSMAYAADRSMLNVAKAVTAVDDLGAVLVLLPGTETVTQRFWHMAHPEQVDWDSLTETVSDLAGRQSEALGGVVDNYYEAVDEILGELLDLASEGATVAVVSDHGYEGLHYDSNGNPMLGYHMYDETGFWVIDGPNVKKGLRCERGSILDFAPTLAAAAGVDLGDRVEGRICREALQ